MQVVLRTLLWRPYRRYFHAGTFTGARYLLWKGAWRKNTSLCRSDPFFTFIYIHLHIYLANGGRKHKPSAKQIKQNNVQERSSQLRCRKITCPKHLGQPVWSYLWSDPAQKKWHITYTVACQFFTFHKMAPSPLEPPQQDKPERRPE